MHKGIQTLTLSEVSELFRLSTATYRRLIRHGEAPVRPLPGSKRYRFSRNDVETLLGPLTGWGTQ